MRSGNFIRHLGESQSLGSARLRISGGARGLVDDVHDVSQEALIIGYRKSVCGVHRLPRPLLLGTLINTRKPKVYDTLTSTRRILFDLMRLLQLVTHPLSEPIACVSSAAWDGPALAGIGALKELGDGTAELKSMRTHPEHLVAFGHLQPFVLSPNQPPERQEPSDSGRWSTFRISSTSIRAPGTGKSVRLCACGRPSFNSRSSSSPARF
jgi:hypothetical protein